MNLPKIQHTNVKDFLNKEDIVRETVEQIIKDFENFGLEINFSGNLDNVYQELHGQVAAMIEVLSTGSSERLYSLLYRIDISDQSIIQAAQEFPGYNHVEVIAHQIIFRDLQKVLTRRYFRQEYQGKSIE